ncbi:MAG: acetyl-CoA carboxylase carboxyltransferase subunit alpha [Simkaniaceae bacterium]
MLNHERPIKECEEVLDKLKEKNKESDVWSDEEIIKLEKKLKELKSKVYSELSPWERVSICRHPNRPHGLDYVQNLCESFEEISGDRLYADDRAVITAFGMIQGKKVVIIAQEKGHDTESRLHHNFGMSHPEGYRKALRAMQLAEKFGLPVLCLIDTPGAFPGLAAEERGQGWAIAKNLLEMAKLRTPTIALVIGEGCSGGALGIGIADCVVMLEHSYYSVISPEGCASILWKESSKSEEAAAALKILPENLLEFGVIDEIIEEPLGGAHHDKEAMFARVKEFVSRKISELKTQPIDTLIENRYQKFRKMGQCINLDETTTQSSSSD